MKNYKDICVLHIPKWYPSRLDIYNGIFIQRHIETTTSFSTPVVVYAQTEDISSWIKLEKDVCQGVTVYRYYYKKHITRIGLVDRFIKLLMYSLCIFKGYREVTKDQKVDLIHAHVLLRTGIMAWLLGKISNTPYLITEHWHTYLDKNSRVKGFWGWICKRIVARSSAVLTVSAALKHGMKHNGLENSRFVVVPNVVDTSIFHPQSDNPSDNQKYTFLHVSEFVDRYKNISGILEAAKQLSNTRDDFEVNIVGYGVDENMLKEKAKSLGLMDRIVFFKGKATPEVVSEHMRQADIFLLFSKIETFGVVLAESLCCGTPILAPNVGGVPEIVDKSNGILVKGEDIHELAEAMSTCIDTPKSAYPSDRISKQATDKYSVAAVSGQLCSVYSTILSTYVA